MEPGTMCRNTPPGAARCWCSRCRAHHPRTSRNLSPRSQPMRSLTSALVFTLASALASAAHAEGILRVCANPNDLPFSNAQGEGFENKLAELIAHDLGKTVSYTWTNEHEHFVKKTLN